MVKELVIDGEPTEHHEDKTIAELREDAGFPIDDIIWWEKGDKIGTVGDKDTVKDIPDGAIVNPQPDLFYTCFPHP